MNKDKALKLALEALENFKEVVVAAQVLGIKAGATGKNMRLGESFIHDEAITAIKKALAPTSTPCEVQPEQELLEYWNAVEGWVKVDEVRQHFDSVGCGTIYKTAGEGREPVYTTPPKREWAGLTDEQKKHAEATCMKHGLDAAIYYIQIKLKELNK